MVVPAGILTVLSIAPTPIRHQWPTATPSQILLLREAVLGQRAGERRSSLEPGRRERTGDERSRSEGSERSQRRERELSSRRAGQEGSDGERSGERERESQRSGGSSGSSRRDHSTSSDRRKRTL